MKMATVTRVRKPTQATDAGPVAYRLTGAQFLKMLRAGIFPKGTQVQLIRGILATESVNRATTWHDGVPVYRLSVSQYLSKITTLILPESAKVELLGGIIVEQMTKHTPHNFAVRELGESLREILRQKWVVSEEKSVETGKGWRPEPDLTVARGPSSLYRFHDPLAADLSLIIEVSESSYGSDRRTKWHGYAAAGIPVYWIVNLAKRVVEVYSSPSGRGKTAKYRESATFGPGELVPIMIEGREVGKVAVDAFMP